MNIEQTARLISAIANGYDPRVASTDPTALQQRIVMWHAALAHLDYTDAKHAVVAHYQDSTETIMPADVIRRCRNQTTISGVLTQTPPCETCGLQQAHRQHHHDGHTYQPPNTGPLAQHDIPAIGRTIPTP